MTRSCDKELLIPPAPDPNLPYLSPIERSAEVLKYSFTCFENSVSPNGGLRKVLKAIGLVFVIAAAAFPAVCVVGVIASMLAAIVSNLLFAAIGGLVLYFIFMAIKRR